MAHKSITLTFDGVEDDYYSLATAGNVLQKARSTLMRLLKSWERVTKSKPRRDHSGRWYLSVASVHKLRDEPDLYLKLAGRATKWEDEKEALELRTKCLENDVATLKGIIENHVPKSVQRRLQTQMPLLKDIDPSKFKKE